MQETVRGVRLHVKEWSFSVTSKSLQFSHVEVYEDRQVGI